MPAIAENPERLRYLFRAVYEDGSEFVQTREDASMIRPGGSCFTDALALAEDSPMTVFELGAFSIDLRTGWFRCGNLPFKIHYDTDGMSAGESLFVGWQANNAAGQSVKRIIELPKDSWDIYFGNQIGEMRKMESISEIASERFNVLAATSPELGIIAVHLPTLSFSINGQTIRLNRFTDKMTNPRPVIFRSAASQDHPGSICYFRNNVFSRRPDGTTTERRHAYNFGWEKGGQKRTIEFD